MKIYVLIANDEDGKVTFNMPTTYGRSIRAYSNKARAKIYARRFNCSVVEFDVEKGKVL